MSGSLRVALAILCFAAGYACAALSMSWAGAQAFWPPPPPEIAAPLDTAAHRYGIRPGFLHCLAWSESRYHPDVRSPGGVYLGLLQFDGQTWAAGSHLAGVPHSNPFDPWAASEVAALLIWHGEVGRWPPARSCGRVWA